MGLDVGIYSMNPVPLFTNSTDVSLHLVIASVAGIFGIIWAHRNTELPRDYRKGETLTLWMFEWNIK